MDLKEAMQRVVAEGYRVIAPGGLDITGWIEQESLLNSLVRPVKPEAPDPESAVVYDDVCACDHRRSQHDDDGSCQRCNCMAVVVRLRGSRPLAVAHAEQQTALCGARSEDGSGCGHALVQHRSILTGAVGRCHHSGCACPQFIA